MRWVTRSRCICLTQAARRPGPRHPEPPAPAGGRPDAKCGRRRSAFNTMQAAPARPIVDDRVRMLTATLPRPEDAHHAHAPARRTARRRRTPAPRFESDLAEMESMVTQTLEFMRGQRRRRGRPADRHHGAAGKPCRRTPQATGHARSHRRQRRRALCRQAAAAEAMPVQPARQRRSATAAAARLRGRGRPGLGAASASWTTVPAFPKRNWSVSSSPSIVWRSRATAAPAAAGSGSASPATSPAPMAATWCCATARKADWRRC
ncbi:MAG: hypothetical protein MZW92_80060 [Comamonadaceae bacterium]|nr:hypothetical protein [Comamonadaceae bacterium]